MSLTSHGSHAAPRRPDGRALATGGIIFGIGLLILTGLMAFLFSSADAAPLHPAAHLASSRAARAAPAAVAAHPAVAARAGGRVTVRSGDTLSRISQREYGRYRCWPGVYRTNQHVIGGNPDFIQVGQRLFIPAACSTALPAVTTSVVTHHTSPPPPAPVPSSGGGGGYSVSSAFQACVIRTESGGNSQIWNASGHYGLYQFSAQTWAAHGGNPADFGHASAAEQTQVFWNTVRQDGTSDWAPYDGC